jgi:hypothetical protein
VCCISEHEGGLCAEDFKRLLKVIYLKQASIPAAWYPEEEDGGDMLELHASDVL